MQNIKCSVQSADALLLRGGCCMCLITLCILIQVRPSHLEVSLHHMPFGSSPRDHQTASYKVALSAVLLQQMDMRQSPESMQVSFRTSALQQLLLFDVGILQTSQ